MSETLYYEHVTERGPDDQVMASTITIATEAEIAEAARLHALGRCPHTIVRDEKTWMWDFRECATCGKGLGML